jgi:hypothetical protein
VLGQVVNRAVLRHEVVGFSGDSGLEEMIVLFVIATHALVLDRDIIVMRPQLEQGFGDLAQEFAGDQHPKAPSFHP